MAELIHNSTFHRNLERACVTVYFQEIIDKVGMGGLVLLSVHVQCSASAAQVQCIEVTWDKAPQQHQPAGGHMRSYPLYSPTPVSQRVSWASCLAEQRVWLHVPMTNQCMLLQSIAAAQGQHTGRQMLPLLTQSCCAMASSS